jgi:hypothetical protein
MASSVESCGELYRFRNGADPRCFTHARGWHWMDPETLAGPINLGGRSITVAARIVADLLLNQWALN